MIKSSNSGIDLEESRRWWDCGRKIRSEWTYEGGTKANRQVAADGNRTRYQFGLHNEV